MEILSAEISESGGGGESCLLLWDCWTVGVVKQVFGEVWKDVLSKYVDFLNYLQEAVVEDIGMESALRKTEERIMGISGRERGEHLRTQARRAHSHGLFQQQGCQSCKA